MKKGNSNKYHRFRIRHPKLHIANMFISMFLPFCLVCLSLLAFKVIEGRAVLSIYSMAGSFVLGAGLLLCIATDYDKEIFLRLNVYPITIGFTIAFGNVFCACNKTLGIDFDEKILLFQLCCYLSVFLFLLFYSLSREAITDRLINKTNLNKDQLDAKKEGFFNYLWYRRIHKEFGIGWMYGFNVSLTTILFLFLVGTVIIPFSKPIAKAVMPLGLISALLSIILEVFVLITAIRNKKSYRKRKTLLGRIPYFYEVSGIAIILLLVWLQIGTFAAL